MYGDNIMKYRLIEATISGIKNLDNPIKIDFINQYPSKSTLSSAHIKTIYGPNGSGKTAIITAFNLYKNVLVQHDFLADSSFPFSELINSKTKKLDIKTIFLSIDTKNKMFEHHIVIDFTNPLSFRVIKETLSVLGRRKEKNVVLEYCDSPNILSVKDYKEYAYSISGRLTSSIATSIVYKVLEIRDEKTFSKIYDYVDLLLFGMSMEIVYGDNSDSPSYLAASKEDDLSSILNNYVQSQEETKIKKINNFDDVVIESQKDRYNKRLVGLTNLVKLMKPELKEIQARYQPIRDGIEGVYLSLLYDNNNHPVGLRFESTGIRKVVRLFDALVAASKGSIVFIDEVDADIHDVFLCTLIDYYARYTDAQLILTTHNVDIMNNVKSLKHSIDFISQDNVFSSWVKNGTKSPSKAYLSGMVSHIPFNLYATDFIGVLDQEEE